MTVNIKINIGLRRISKSTDPTIAGYTRRINQEMKAIASDLKTFVKGLEDATAAVLKDALKPVFEESQRLVPVDTEKLKRSGFLKSRDEPNGGSVEIGYAKGGNPRYAALVHERMDVFHDPPTQAKFLERPLNEKFFEVQKQIINSYRTAFK